MNNALMSTYSKVAHQMTGYCHWNCPSELSSLFQPANVPIANRSLVGLHLYPALLILLCTSGILKKGKTETIFLKDIGNHKIKDFFYMKFKAGNIGICRKLLQGLREFKTNLIILIKFWLEKYSLFRAATVIVWTAQNGNVLNATKIAQIRSLNF